MARPERRGSSGFIVSSVLFIEDLFVPCCRLSVPPTGGLRAAVVGTSVVYDCLPAMAKAGRLGSPLCTTAQMNDKDSEIAQELGMGALDTQQSQKTVSLRVQTGG